MRLKTRRCHTVVLLTLLLASTILGACGNSNKKSTSPAVAQTQAVQKGMNACVTCHTAIVADWITTKHANANGGDLNSPGNPTVAGVAAGDCARCHDPLGDSQRLTAGLTGNAPRPVVGCESCHGFGSLHADSGGAGAISRLSNTTGTGVLSGQFVMCTTCHELLDSLGTGTVAAVHDPASSVTPTGMQYTITDSHFATGGDWSGVQGANNVLYIAGYAMNFADERVCVNCHNPHKPADINREWAASGHAFRGPENPPFTYNPWSHYNWTCDTAANCGGMGAFGDRTTCQRCHTTTGYAAYADALKSGNTSLANAIFLGSQPALAYNASFKPEMLECTGCHIDNRGNLRNPGAYKALYKIPIGGFPSIFPLNADLTYQYPDISASNVCMPCHTGRGSGRAIHDLNTGKTAMIPVDFGVLGFPDGHYLTAGGTMFKGTAYEYSGRSYVDPSSFKHNQIGTPNAPNTGSNGPCVGCHMDRSGMGGNHLFEPVSTNTATIIVSSEICYTCHAGSSIDFGIVVQDEKENFEFALEALGSRLSIVSGFTFTTAYPYFANTNWLSPGDSDTTGNTTGKNNMGAAFNMSLLHHEPGAYVHNSRYVKRVIYDSLDWTDDGLMNYSVGASLSSACTSTPEAWCNGAIKYLLPNGVLWQQGPWPNGYGVSAERP